MKKKNLVIPHVECQNEITRKKISNSLKAYYDKIGRKSPSKNLCHINQLTLQVKKLKFI
jgi:hypothetical protein